MPCRTPSSPRSAGPTPSAARPPSRPGCTASSSTPAWTGCAARRSRCAGPGDLGELDLPDLHDHHASVETRLDVREALARLPEGQRMALVLVDMHGTAGRRGGPGARRGRGHREVAVLPRPRGPRGDPRRRGEGGGRAARVADPAPVPGTDGTAGSPMTSHPRPEPLRPAPPDPATTAPRARPGGPRDPAPRRHRTRRARPDGHAGPAGEPARPRADARRPRRPDQRRPRGRGGAWRRHRPVLAPGRRTPPAVRRPGPRARMPVRTVGAAPPPASGCATSGSQPPSWRVLGLGGYRRRGRCTRWRGGLPDAIGLGRLRRTPPDGRTRRRRLRRGRPARSAARGPAAGSGEVVVVMSGVDHTSDRLEVTARELDDGTLDPIADLSAESPAHRPDRARRSGHASCADALGIPADAGILVDVAEVDGVRRPSSSSHADAGPHGVGGRPLLHHRQHRPHQRPGAARLSPARLAHPWRDRRGAAGAGTPRP